MKLNQINNNIHFLFINYNTNFTVNYFKTSPEATTFPSYNVYES